MVLRIELRASHMVSACCNTELYLQSHEAVCYSNQKQTKSRIALLGVERPRDDSDHGSESDLSHF